MYLIYVTRFGAVAATPFYPDAIWSLERYRKRYPTAQIWEIE